MGFILHFTQRRQEDTNSLPAPKLWQHLSMHVRLSRWPTDVMVN